MNDLKSALKEKEEESKSLLMDSTQQKKLIISQIEMKKKDKEDHQKILEELERDKQELEEEMERLNDNLQKIGHSNVDIRDILKNDVDKCRDSLKLLDQKMEDSKMQIMQNEKMMDNTNTNVSKYRENLEGFKKELFGKLAYFKTYYRS